MVLDTGKASARKRT